MSEVKRSVLLVIEDDEDTRETLEFALATGMVGERNRVITTPGVASAKKELDTLSKQHARVVILSDLVAPTPERTAAGALDVFHYAGHCGVQLADVNFVLTAHSGSLEQLGINEATQQQYGIMHLTKPFDLDDFEAVLEQALSPVAAESRNPKS